MALLIGNLRTFPSVQMAPSQTKASTAGKPAMSARSVGRYPARPTFVDGRIPGTTRMWRSALRRFRLRVALSRDRFGVTNAQAVPGNRPKPVSRSTRRIRPYPGCSPKRASDALPVGPFPSPRDSNPASLHLRRFSRPWRFVPLQASRRVSARDAPRVCVAGGLVIGGAIGSHDRSRSISWVPPAGAASARN
jgi:hypothetical protein